MSDVQLDLFDMPYVDTRSELEKENERLKDALMSYTFGEDISSATEKLLMLIIKRMGRYLGENNRRRIILSSFYTLYKDKDIDEMTFENVLNSHIHDFNLMCHDWDDYYAERRPSRRMR